MNAGRQIRLAATLLTKTVICNLESKPDIEGNVAFRTILLSKQLINGVNQLVFVIAKQGVFCEVETLIFFKHYLCEIQI
jgi:hypothetical protein